LKFAPHSTTVLKGDEKSGDVRPVFHQFLTSSLAGFQHENRFISSLPTSYLLVFRSVSPGGFPPGFQRANRVFSRFLTSECPLLKPPVVQEVVEAVVEEVFEAVVKAVEQLISQ
jgi:hypothetical protein